MGAGCAGHQAVKTLARRVGPDVEVVLDHRGRGGRGGRSAAAGPLRVPLSGRSAEVVTRAHHLSAMPGNRLRVATDRALDAVVGRQTVHLGLVSPRAPLETAVPRPRRTALRAPLNPVVRRSGGVGVTDG